MKKKIVAFLLAITVLPCNAFAAESERLESEIESFSTSNVSKSIDGFNGYKWGTKISDIRQAEISEDSEEGTDYAIADSFLVINNQKIAGFNASAVYRYNGNKVLTAGQYTLKEQHETLDAYYDDYADLVQSFSSVYGEPEFTGDNWYDDTYKDDPSNLGLAISMGDVEFKTVWKDVDGNTISILLNGANSTINTAIYYDSIDFASLPIGNFEGYKWGTPRDDIMANEITNDMEEPFDYMASDTLIQIFDDSAAGYDTDISYLFDKTGKLIGGKYSLAEEHSEKLDYYNDFCDLAELYTEKYGQLYMDEKRWLNDWYKDDPSKWGLAVSAGHLIVTKQWKDPDGNYIIMELWGYDYNIVTNIFYIFSGYK